MFDNKSLNYRQSVFFIPCIFYSLSRIYSRLRIHSAASFHCFAFFCKQPTAFKQILLNYSLLLFVIHCRCFCHIYSFEHVNLLYSFFFLQVHLLYVCKRKQKCLHQPSQSFIRSQKEGKRERMNKNDEEKKRRKEANKTANISIKKKRNT